MDKIQLREHSVPDAVHQWQKRLIKRRSFLKRLTSVAALAALPLSLSAFSATSAGKKRFLRRNPEIFTTKQWEIMLAVQQHLFPADKDSPGASDIHAAPYLQWVVSDPNLDPEIGTFLRNGFDWLEEEAIDNFQESFLKMNENERESLLRKVEETNWGGSWLSVILLYIFEALLTDPIYGANPDGVGWAWLEHHPGYPRPDERTKYGRL